MYIVVMIALAIVAWAVLSRGPSWIWTVLAVITFADLSRKYVRRRRRIAAAADATAIDG
jgi:hypothetical protein